MTSQPPPPPPLPGWPHPRYTHTCELCGHPGQCTWLGPCEIWDLYACRSLERGVVFVARYGSQEHSCATLSWAHYRGSVADLIEPFATCRRRAASIGVINLGNP